MKAHAAAHGYDVSNPLYHHVRFMLRHPDWTTEPFKRSNAPYKPTPHDPTLHNDTLPNPMDTHEPLSDEVLAVLKSVDASEPE